MGMEKFGQDGDCLKEIFFFELEEMGGGNGRNNNNNIFKCSVL